MREGPQSGKVDGKSVPSSLLRGKGGERKRPNLVPIRQFYIEGNSTFFICGRGKNSWVDLRSVNDPASRGVFNHQKLPIRHLKEKKKTHAGQKKREGNLCGILNGTAVACRGGKGGGPWPSGDEAPAEGRKRARFDPAEGGREGGKGPPGTKGGKRSPTPATRGKKKNAPPGGGRKGLSYPNPHKRKRSNY